MPGPTGTPNNSPSIDVGTMVKGKSPKPGVTGRGEVDSAAKDAAAPHLLVYLDLSELIYIEQPGKGEVAHKDTGEKVSVFVKGPVINSDRERPAKVLALVQKLFEALQDVLSLSLTDSAIPDRLLRAKFGWPLVNTSGEPQVSKKHGQFYDSHMVGAGALGRSRSRTETFKPIKGDENKGVTAYVFEGAVGLLIMEYLGEDANVDNIFATSIAHELGHNMGLEHVASASDVMFIFADQVEAAQKRWVESANKFELRFTKEQISKMRKLILKR